MSIKILHQDRTEVVGTGYVLLVTPHHMGLADLYPGMIVEDAALIARTPAIIGKHSGSFDGEQLRLDTEKMRLGIETTAKENGIKCIIELRGKPEPGIIVESGSPQNSGGEILNLVKDILAKSFETTLS